MLILRKALIQNPYDQIGRGMASDAKKIFLRQVLKETNWVHKLQGLIKIPSSLKKRDKVKKVLLMLPIVLAFWGTAQKGFFYLYDIYTDVKVIKELESIPEIKTPAPPINSLETFLLNYTKEHGIPALRKPCETLDVLEEIPNQVIPFYKPVVGDIANIHWNPTRNSSFPLSDAFKITKRLSEIYKDAMNSVKKSQLQGNLPSKPSDIKRILDDSKRLLKKAKNSLDDANSGAKKFFLSLFSDFNAREYLPIVNSAIRILSHLEQDVLNTELVNHILEKADEIYKDRNFKETTYPEMVRIFSTEINHKLNPANWKDQGQNSPEDPFARQLNRSQIECRSFIRQLFRLGENRNIKEWVLHYYTSKKSKNSVNEVANTVNAKTKFLTKNIIRSVYFFLVLNMAWTLLIEARSTMVDFWKSKHKPLVTNFQMICQENDPKFSLVTSSNEYVVKSSKRHSLNILEATNETVSAINVQVALWAYMSTCLEEIRSMYKDSFNFHVTNSMFNLSDNSFTDFNSSAMMSSLVAGIFSLTFAQYKQYMTRHEKDAEFSGKIVYFLSCVFNSFAIFASQIAYFTVGLPSFICILIYVIRLIVNFDQYDTMPDSADSIIIILVLTLVLLPLKFIPIKFAEMIKYLTERFFLHKKYHINERNRSGYDVPGFDTALFMFLPSSQNNLSHVDNKESFSNPGFYYFSKDPLSKELYRLRFEIQLFCKVLMHTFYLVFSFLLLNTLHLLLLESTVVSSDYWLRTLADKDSFQVIIGMFFLRRVEFTETFLSPQ